MTSPWTTTEALVLRGVDYREADRIVTVFSERLGKITVLARGARSQRRRLGGTLDPFVLLELTVAPGRGELWRLSEIRTVDAFAGLSAALPRIGAAASLLELARDLSPEHDPDPGLFAVLRHWLRLLAGAEGTGTVALEVAGTLRVLARLGSAPSVEACRVCGTPAPPGRPLHFDPLGGGVVCTPCGGGPITLSKAAAGALRRLAADEPAALASDPLEAGPLAEVSEALERFCEHLLGRPRKSAAFRAQTGRR